MTKRQALKRHMIAGSVRRVTNDGVEKQALEMFRQQGDVACSCRRCEAFRPYFIIIRDI